MKNRNTLSLWIFLITVLWPLSALAHVGSGEAGGFLIGFQHPVSGWDHVLAMLAVGLWGAQLGAPAVWILPVVFPMMMAMGGMLGLMGIPLPGVEAGIAISAVVLGFMVLTEARLKIQLAMVCLRGKAACFTALALWRPQAVCTAPVLPSVLFTAGRLEGWCCAPPDPWSAPPESIFWWGPCHEKIYDPHHRGFCLYPPLAFDLSGPSGQYRARPVL
jgi:hypothetical protein